MSMGPVADGGSRSSYSNLSASAQPFTLNRTISSSICSLPANISNEELCAQFHNSCSSWMHNQAPASIPDLISGFTDEITSLSVHIPPLNPQCSWSDQNHWYARDSSAPNANRNSVNPPFAHIDYSDSMRASVVESDSQYSLCPKISAAETNNLAITGRNCCYDLLCSSLDEAYQDGYSAGSRGDEPLCDTNHFSEGFLGTERVKQLDCHGSCALTKESCFWIPQSYDNYSSSENSAAEPTFNPQEITSISGRSGTDVNRNGISIKYVSNGCLPRTAPNHRLECAKSSLSDYASSSSESRQKLIFQKKSFPPVVIRPPVSISHPPALDLGLSRSPNLKSTDLISKSGSSLDVLENSATDFNKRNGPLLKSSDYPHNSEGDGSLKINFSDFNITNTGVAPDHNSLNTRLQVKVPKGDPDGSLRHFDCCSSSVTVDSPCWKGISSSNISPFHISSVADAQLCIKEFNELNSHDYSKKSPPDSHEGISSVKKYDDCYPITNGNRSSSSSPPPEEPHTSELLSSNQNLVISGNGESQTQILRNQVVIGNPSLDGCGLELRRRESVDNNLDGKSEFRNHDIYKVSEGSGIICENMPFTNVTPSDSEKAEVHLSERIISLLKISGDRPIDRSKKLSHRLQTHMIINTLKTLSELLLFQYSGGYDMMENDFEAIQHIIDNLCLFKKENEFSMQQNISVRHQKGGRVFDASDACWDSMKEIIGRRKFERGDTGQDAMLYKYLWLEAEAALSYMGYKDRLAHFKQGL